MENNCQTLLTFLDLWKVHRRGLYYTDFNDAMNIYIRNEYNQCPLEALAGQLPESVDETKACTTLQSMIPNIDMPFVRMIMRAADGQYHNTSYSPVEDISIIRIALMEDA